MKSKVKLVSPLDQVRTSFGIGPWILQTWKQKLMVLLIHDSPKTYHTSSWRYTWRAWSQVLLTLQKEACRTTGWIRWFLMKTHLSIHLGMLLVCAPQEPCTSMCRSMSSTMIFQHCLCTCRCMVQRIQNHLSKAGSFRLIGCFQVLSLDEKCRSRSIHTSLVWVVWRSFLKSFLGALHIY